MLSKLYTGVDVSTYFFFEKKIKSRSRSVDLLGLLLFFQKKYVETYFPDTQHKKYNQDKKNKTKFVLFLFRVFLVCGGKSGGARFLLVRVDDDTKPLLALFHFFGVKADIHSL